MASPRDPFKALRTLASGGKSAQYYSLPALEQSGLGKISRLPVSIRLVLESLLRNCDGVAVTEQDVRALAAYNAAKPVDTEIPFVVARIVLQDFTGVPLLVDLAAMREAVARLGKDSAVIEPLVPVDLVVDHSVQVDRAGTADAFRANLALEFERNRERYEFLKWGMQAFETFGVVPPAIGIVHQVNLEHLAKLVFEKDGILYPDTLVGTDSHTTMINGIGVVGWGVGGIEAEAGMLGQPVAFQTPEVIGVNLTGSLREGVTATDLTLRLTELLRKAKVVGKFVEFFGPGTAALSLADRATIANMAPEYGATMGFFPVDEKSLAYLRATGREESHIALVRDYYQAQGLFGIPRAGDIDYTQVLELNLGDVVPCVSGPKRPQDRIDLPRLKETFNTLFTAPKDKQGFAKDPATRGATAPVGATGRTLGHGAVVIAAITSCTNTSNPSVMLAAGLLAKKAVERGLKVNPSVKCSLAPGSRVVTDYLAETGLTPYLDQLGFNLVGYGCTTCIGNSGPLDPDIEKAIKDGDLVTASVLSGNRNFEARVHGAVRANFLMSPPLVVAFALAGRADIDLDTEPLGAGADGKPVFLRDLWPTRAEIEAAELRGLRPAMFKAKYAPESLANATAEWKSVQGGAGARFSWRADSTYIQEPPFFQGFSMTPPAAPGLAALRPLAILGDSVTTDHISPAGSFKEDTPAGKFLVAAGVAKRDFNSYGSRRGNDRIMTRGTFANTQVKNALADGKEGGFTKLMPEGRIETIFDACEAYRRRGTGLIVFGGVDYGMGSSRDWAAKGTALLGVRAVVAQSFERIHRSNLIGMGVLPLEFAEGRKAADYALDGTETFDLEGVSAPVKPRQAVSLVIRRADGRVDRAPLVVRIDTAIESEYYRHGGILPYVLRQILAR
ncbi:MAG: aconitate hydratase AcnA [Opitutia bacterium]|jgi:aconitate hydratase